MKKRKILYVTQPAFLDFDLPLIKRLSGNIDITVLIRVSPLTRATTIFNIGNIQLPQGFFKLSDIKDHLSSDFNNYLDYKKTYVFNTNYSSAKHIINLIYQFKVYYFIKSNGFKIIHVNGQLGLNMILPVYDNSIFKILNIHDPFPHSGKVYKADIWSTKNNIEKSNKFILFNKSQRNDFIKKYNLNSIDVINVSIGIYETYNKKYLSTKKLDNTIIRFLFFGRILPYKGLEYLVGACEVLVNQGYHIECVIAGAGEIYFENTFMNKSSNIKLINRYIPEEELANLINNSHAIVCPYKDATQSGVVMTTYALKKPVIGTRTGGLQEMIIDGETGFLANPKDSIDLAMTMKRFIENYNDIDFEQNIEKYFYKGQFSWAPTVNSILSLYKSL